MVFSGHISHSLLFLMDEISTNTYHETENRYHCFGTYSEQTTIFMRLLKPFFASTKGKYYEKIFVSLHSYINDNRIASECDEAPSRKVCISPQALHISEESSQTFFKSFRFI
jgi:hypothetical protein